MKIYVCGGTVRDELLGIIPKDIDYVVVGATPADMIAQGFSQVGADFPVFLHPETGDEYALARTERKVGTGYHGFDVSSDPNITLITDLERRDLTINAMAFDIDSGEIIDPFNGRKDLKDKILRHVSPAFAEDPLRVVRLARFSARFPDFTIANSTMDMVREVVDSGELDFLPPERFWAEMTKVMSEPDPCKFFWTIAFMAMDERSTFFANLYGQLYFKKIVKMCQVISALEFRTAEGRLAVHTALTAKQDSHTIMTAPLATQNLFNNIWRVRMIKEVSAFEVFNVLSSARAWSQSHDMATLLNAMEVGEKAGEKFVINSHMLEDAWFATKKVTSEAYIDKFSGKELGEAIKQGRKTAIEKVIQLTLNL